MPKSCLEKPPSWRSARARKAGAAARRTRHQRCVDRARQFQNKGAAYSAGYRLGYQAAMRWWKWRAEKIAKAAA